MALLHTLNGMFIIGVLLLSVWAIVYYVEEDEWKKEDLCVIGISCLSFYIVLFTFFSGIFILGLPPKTHGTVLPKS
jgi:hypothetical protein